MTGDSRERDRSRSLPWRAGRRRRYATGLELIQNAPMADDCRLWYSSCPALDREVRSWHGSASNASLETHVLPQIDVFIGSSNQGLANRLGVFYFAVMLAAALNPDARPIRSQPALKMVGGVFYGFPGVTVHEQEVKRVHLLARRTELLCWTDWQHPPANKLDLSGCGNPNAHEVNILSLCETLTSVMRKRPRSITIGTYYHPSKFSHPWFRQFDRLVPELYAPPQPQPAPRTAIMHMRRCFVDPPYDVFVAECGAADPHFYPSLPSAYFANILGHVRVPPHGAPTSPHPIPDPASAPGPIRPTERHACALGMWTVPSAPIVGCSDPRMPLIDEAGKSEVTLPPS